VVRKTQSNTKKPGVAEPARGFHKVTKGRFA
jgi:hypothetical protein